VVGLPFQPQMQAALAAQPPRSQTAVRREGCLAEAAPEGQQPPQPTLILWLEVQPRPSQRPAKAAMRAAFTFKAEAALPEEPPLLLRRLQMEVQLVLKRSEVAAARALQLPLGCSERAAPAGMRLQQPLRYQPKVFPRTRQQMRLGDLEALLYLSASLPAVMEVQRTQLRPQALKIVALQTRLRLQAAESAGGPEVAFNVHAHLGMLARQTPLLLLPQ
jgi:hypothetical protein